MPAGSSGGLRTPRDDEEDVMIRRWLRVADEVIRQDGGKKGGERDARQPGAKPAKPPASRGSPDR